MAERDLYQRLGRRIAAERKTAMLTQTQLAEQVGMSRAGLASIETGRQQLLVHHLVEIARVLCIGVNQLLKISETQIDFQRPFVGMTLTPAQIIQVQNIMIDLEKAG